MDHEAFDRLARVLGAVGSRRTALGALLGLGLAGTLGAAEAAKKDRGKKRKSGKKGRGEAQVSAQAADCLSPGPSSNMNGCDFAGEDFSGQDLSGSSMVGTIFRNAELVETNLSSSNMRGANFRGADLECADLSSSVLRNADFRGFNPLAGGRPTNLTGADLSSSGGCGSILTNQFTILCGTTWCDGTVRNDACPGGPPSDLCCPGCGDGEECVDNQCVPSACPEPFVCGGAASNCAPDGGECPNSPPGVARCLCFANTEGGVSCVDRCVSCGARRPCTSSAECGDGFACVTPASTCCATSVCDPLCGTAAVAASARRAGQDGVLMGVKP